MDITEPRPPSDSLQDPRFDIFECGVISIFFESEARLVLLWIMSPAEDLDFLSDASFVDFLSDPPPFLVDKISYVY